MYTPNLHIGILEDTTSVEVVGALRELSYLKTVKTSLVKTTHIRYVTEIVSSAVCHINSVLCDYLKKLDLFSSPSEQISQM